MERDKSLQYYNLCEICYRETNLKCRQCLPETAEMMDNHELIGQFDGEIVCETPNNLLNKFDGTLTWKGRK